MAKPGPGSKPTGNQLKRETAFLCPIEFKNDLPAVPVDWKFLRVPVGTGSFVKYSHADLQDEMRKDAALVSDLGITLDPMVARAFRVPATRVSLAKADAALLEDGDGAKARTGLVERGKNVKRPDLSKALWLMNTQYISSATMPEHLGRSEQAYAKGKAGGVGGDFGVEDDGLSSRERQIAAIENSFASAKRAPSHVSGKAGVTPVEIIPVLPDFKRLRCDHLHFVFDEDPTKDVGVLSGANDSEKSAAMERAIAKPFTVTTGEGPSKVLGLMLPADPTLETVFASAPDSKTAEQYHWIREYKYAVDVENDPMLGTMVFFFDTSTKTATYVDLHTKISLSKRSKYSYSSGESAAPAPSSIAVKRAAPDSNETAKRQKRLITLTDPDARNVREATTETQTEGAAGGE